MRGTSHPSAGRLTIRRHAPPSTQIPQNRGRRVGFAAGPDCDGPVHFQINARMELSQRWFAPNVQSRISRTFCETPQWPGENVLQSRSHQKTVTSSDRGLQKAYDPESSLCLHSSMKACMLGEFSKHGSVLQVGVRWVTGTSGPMK